MIILNYVQNIPFSEFQRRTLPCLTASLKTNIKNGFFKNSIKISLSITDNIHPDNYTGVCANYSIQDD